MTVDQIKRKLGIAEDSELARFFHVTRAAVHNWKLWGAAPAGRVAEVKFYLATGSKPEKRARRGIA